MKIILMSVGTRGDMEPFLAIGAMLRERGHEVICAFPEQFRHLAEDSNIEFASLGTEFIEMLESETGKAALGGSGSGLKKFFALIKLAVNQTELNKKLVEKQAKLVKRETPDRIVYNGKTVYPIIWEMDHRDQSILVSPVPYMHYVREHSHVAFNSNFGPFLNRLTYALANSGLITTVRITAKWLKIKPKIDRKKIKEILSSNKVIYTISPSLFKRPEYWLENLKVAGYHTITNAGQWRPDEALELFLQKHEKILFITFGSMMNPEPEAKTGIILEILERNKISAIINTASGGVKKPEQFTSDYIHFTERIPYDWIFPKVYGVIHHGGSGTTHLALKYGCASMIIPHIIDQFVWNKIVHRLGAGPKGIKIRKVTSRNLEPRILDLVNNPSYKQNAEQIAARMVKEDFKTDLIHFIVG